MLHILLIFNYLRTSNLNSRYVSNFFRFYTPKIKILRALWEKFEYVDGPYDPVVSHQVTPSQVFLKSVNQFAFHLIPQPR